MVNNHGQLFFADINLPLRTHRAKCRLDNTIFHLVFESRLSEAGMKTQITLLVILFTAILITGYGCSSDLTVALPAIVVNSIEDLDDPPE